MRNASFQTYTFIESIMEPTEVLHKTTYVWKEEKDFTIVIKSDGEKVILNKTDTIIWKNINDDDSVQEIFIKLSDVFTYEKLCNRLNEFVKIGIITNKDMFWGDDL